MSMSPKSLAEVVCRSAFWLLFVVAVHLQGCVEDPQVTTGSLSPTGKITSGQQRAKGVPKAEQARHVDHVSLAARREWCELRQKDIRAGKAPLGEKDPKQVSIGNFLCERWFGEQLARKIPD